MHETVDIHVDGESVPTIVQGPERARSRGNGHLGAVDPVTPPETIDALRDAFAAHPDARVVVHDGARHGFSHDGDAWDGGAFTAGLASVAELLGITPR